MRSQYGYQKLNFIPRQELWMLLTAEPPLQPSPSLIFKPLPFIWDQNSPIFWHFNYVFFFFFWCPTSMSGWNSVRNLQWVTSLFLNLESHRLKKKLQRLHSSVLGTRCKEHGYSFIVSHISPHLDCVKTIKILFTFIKICFLLFYMFGCFVYMYACSSCVFSAYKGQKRASDSLALEW